MKKLTILLAVVLITISFGITQDSNELRGGVTDPGVPDPANESANNQTENTSVDSEDSDDSSTASCGKGPSSEASSTAKQVLNVIFCTSQNIGETLSSLLGG